MDTPNLKAILDQFACEGLDSDWATKHDLACLELQKLQSYPLWLKTNIRCRIGELELPSPPGSSITEIWMRRIMSEVSCAHLRWVLGELEK